MNVIPYGPRMLVRRDTPATMSEAGIVIPAGALELPTTGIIISCGDAAIGFSPNQRIMFSTYAGTSVKVNGEDLLMLKVEEVLATLTD